MPTSTRPLSQPNNAVPFTDIAPAKKLNEIPNELPLIGEHLSNKDYAALASLNKGMRAQLINGLKNRRVLDKAQRIIPGNALRITNPDEFSAVLGTAGQPDSIRSLPSRLQAAPLSVLGYKIAELSDEDQPAAIKLFLDAFEEIPVKHRSPALIALQEAALATPKNAIEQVRNRAARNAIREGKNVQKAAAGHGITDKTTIFFLEKVAGTGPAGDDVRAGQNVQRVAVKYGITEDHVISGLEEAAAVGPAWDEVRAGKNKNEVAAKYGIRRERDHLLDAAALTGLDVDAVEGGQNVQVVADRDGIVGRRRNLLETIAVRGPATAAILAGGNVQEVAAMYGITLLLRSRDLERIAARGPATAAILAGGNMQEIVARLGITKLILMRELELFAADKAAGELLP